MKVKDSEKVTVNTNGVKKKEPLFHCRECKRYYLYDSNILPAQTKGPKATYHEEPVYKCSIKYRTTVDNTDSIWKKKTKPAAEKNKVQKKTKEARNAVAKKEPVKEKVARIHVLKENDLDSKLKANIASLKKAYPQVMPEQMKIHDLITKVFPAKLKQQIVVRNESFIGNNGNVIRRVSLYSKSSSYLSRRLPEDMYLSFGGRFILGEFVIDEMRLLEHPMIKEDDIETDMTFYYDGQNLANWLYNVTEDAAEQEQHLTGEIASWNEYLDWKRQLAELRIRGLKYIGYKFDVENRELIFLTVAEGKENFDEFRKYLRRNEVSAFSNNYSNDRWSFEFNRDYQNGQNNDDGVSLTFVRCGRQYGSLSEIETYEWDTLKDYAKKYENDRDSGTRSLISGINRNYFEPYVMELVFEFTANANTMIERQIRRMGSIQDDVEETMAGELYADGYIATSQIGDFALLHRLKGAVNNLVMGKAASQGLDQWLFDINKARTPQEIKKISTWQNSDINEKQKEAVEKILSVPDVCLIQGPPGTGKTTVIAEAIYQLVIRNKRVLVASQANLAVDNALERLISNPKIRAIRLGSAKKIDSSVSNITEGNVLESFYDSIVQYVDGNFVSKWNQIDARLQGGEVDYHRFQNVDGEVDALKKKIDDRKQKISQIDARGNSNEEFELQNKLRTEKISLIMLQSYCQGNTKDLELMLDKEGIIKIWNVIQPILKSLQNTGLWLTHVDVDVDDLDSAVRINRTNDNLKYIITGARNDITLLDRLKVSSDFGGDTKELEELKIQETLLTEEMMNNPTTEVLEKWRNVKKKIADFNSTGVGLTDAELKQFDMDVLSTMSDDQKRKYIEDVLEKALPFINTLFHRLEEVVQELLKSISDQQVAFEEDRQSQELQKQELSKEIADFQQEIGLKYKIRDAVLHKYKATPDNLLEKIAQVYEQAKRQYRTSIERDDWEEIFRGLENWVQDIPDYQQEYSKYFWNRDDYS